MVVSLQFFFYYYFYFIFSGRGLFIIFSKANFIDEDISNLKIFTIPINYFYILTFLIFLGNITFILHFFIKIPERLGLVISVILVLFNFFNIKKLNSIFLLLVLP